MGKWLAILIPVMLVLMMTACGSGPSATTPAAASPAITTPATASAATTAPGTSSAATTSAGVTVSTTTPPIATATTTATGTTVSAGSTFTRQQLAQYDGKDGRKAYVAVDGIVYDVTNNRQWASRMHQGRHEPGQDFTQTILQAPHMKRTLEKLPRVGTLID